MRLFELKYWVIALVCIPVISCTHKEQPLFELLPSSQTNIHFVNHVTDDDRPGILDYLYFYNGGGVAVGDINNDGLPDIYFTANKRGGNKLYLNKFLSPSIMLWKNVGIVNPLWLLKNRKIQKMITATMINRLNI